MKNEELQLRKKAHSFVERVKEVKVRSQPTLDLANALIVRIKNARTEITDYFSDAVNKSKEAERASKEAYRALVLKVDEIEEPLVEAELAIKEKIKVYLLAEEQKREDARRKQEQEQREAQEKADALRAKGHHEEADEAEDEIAPVYEKPAPKMTGAHAREHYRWRCVNLKKVPRSHLILDTLKINREVRTKKDKTQIAGIEVYKDLTIAKS